MLVIAAAQVQQQSWPKHKPAEYQWLQKPNFGTMTAQRHFVNAVMLAASTLVLETRMIS
jgi:hypothetical protein